MQVIEKTLSKKNKGGGFVIPDFKMIHSYGNQNHMAVAGEQAGMQRHRRNQRIKK